MTSNAVEVLRQVRATESRPLRKLPPEWFEDGLAERMAEHIKREERLREQAS